MAISSLRGTIDFWVGMHRSHHRYSDRTDEKSHLDPYNAGFGFWNGYLGWALKVENKEDFYNYFKKYAQDLTLDPDLKYFNKMGIDLYFNIFLGFITYLMFGFLGLSMILGLRLTLMHQAVYLTNSIGHGHGPLNYRNFDTKDLSSNNWFLSIIAWGDGWHNNHHAFPSSAKNTYKFWEIDPSYWFISLLEKIGIANDVNTGIDDLT